MLDVIGCVIMVMCISIVPLFFGAVVVSIIREGKRRKKVCPECKDKGYIESVDEKDIQGRFIRVSCTCQEVNNE